MELKKNIKNNYWLFCLITICICFFLGYVLLASLDKNVYPTIDVLYMSIFTVYTEFGMLIFPVLILYTFTNDYKNKNILFYKLMGFNGIKYFLNKFLISFIFMSIISFCGLLAVAILYRNFSDFIIVVFYFESVLLYEVIIFSIWGFLIKNMIVGYVVNFSFWLTSIILSTVNSKISFLARYDAANKVYLDFEKYLKIHDKSYLDITGNCVYSFILVMLSLIIVYIFRKRWEHNGI